MILDKRSQELAGTKEKSGDGQRPPPKEIKEVRIHAYIISKFPQHFIGTCLISEAPILMGYNRLKSSDGIGSLE